MFRAFDGAMRASLWAEHERRAIRCPVRLERDSIFRRLVQGELLLDADTSTYRRGELS